MAQCTMVSKILAALGVLACVYGLYSVVSTWKKTMEELITWDVADADEFDMVCEDPDVVMLYYKKDDGDTGSDATNEKQCKEVYAGITVEFDQGTVEYPKDVAVATACEKEQAENLMSMVKQKKAVARYQDLSGRRLDEAADYNMAYSLVAAFTFYNKTSDSEPAPECVEGEYTVKSTKKNLYGIRVIKKAAAAVVGLIAIITASVGGVFSVCCGAICCCVSLCVCACSEQPQARVIVAPGMQMA